MIKPAALSRIEAAKYCGVEPGYFDKVIIPLLTPGAELIHNPEDLEKEHGRKKASYLVACLDSYLQMRREQGQNRVLIPGRKLQRAM